MPETAPLEAEAITDATENTPPHYLGHRQRQREKLLAHGAESLADYELLEIVLFGAIPRGDVKPLAKLLMAKFGSLPKLLSATPEALLQVPGVGESVVAQLKIIPTIAARMLVREAASAPVLGQWHVLLDYCQLAMGDLPNEQFRILFLNHKNMLIADEVQQEGSVNHVAVYVRNVVKRTLDLGASAVILVHNHPSGDATPSQSDIDLTRQIKAGLEVINVRLHDHLIIARGAHYSFKSNGLL